MGALSNVQFETLRTLVRERAGRRPAQASTSRSQSDRTGSAGDGRDPPA